MSAGTATLDYDYENRLVKITYPDSGTTELVYDALGRRLKMVEKDAGGATLGVRHYVYDGLDLIAELDGNDTLEAAYTHGPGVDDPLIVRYNGNDYFYQTNHQGSVTELMNADGYLAKRYRYDAFGNIISETGPTFNRGFTYTSRERHARSGFYYYRARFYDPATGRFLTPDPIGHLGGVNLYAYVGNSPVYYIDPHGLFFERFWDNPEERANHMDQAKSMEDFIRYTQGKSLKELQHERDQGLASDRGAHGPNTPFRYVINPNNPNEAIDMRHFLVVGPQGELAGLVGEILQLRGDNQSAFDAQDFLSNALGADFFDGYDPNRAIDDQLREYFYGKGKKTCEE